MLFTGGAGQYFVFGHRVWASGRARFPRSSRWLASPSDITCNSECPAAGLRAPVPRGSDRSCAGDTAGPFAASSVRMGTLAALYQVVPTIVAVGTTAPRSHLGATPAAPTMVTNQDIVYQVEYAGNLAHGGFGPALQDGCWGCATQAAPGGSLVEMAMLTDNRRAQPLTVTSVSVLPPFQLLNDGPHVP